MMMLLINKIGIVLQNVGVPDIYVSDVDFCNLIKSPGKAQKLRETLMQDGNLLIGKLGENMGDFYVDLETYIPKRIEIDDNEKELEYYELL